MAKGYWIAHVDVTDPDVYATYIAANPADLREIRRPVSRSRRSVRGAGRAEPSAQRRHRIPRLCDGPRLLSFARIPGEQRAARGSAVADLVIIEGYDAAAALMSAPRVACYRAAHGSTDMRLVVVGAAGRMGRTLIRVIAANAGRRRSPAPIERPDRPDIGRDSGELAGLGPNGVAIGADPLPPSPRPTASSISPTPAATRRCSPISPRRRASSMSSARPGFRPSDEAAIAAAARHATIVKSGNMSLGVNLLAVLVRAGGAGARRATSTSRSSRCTTPQGRRALRHRASARRGGGRRARHRARRPLACAAATAIPGRASAATSASPRCAAARWSASTPSSSPARARCIELAHQADDRAIFARGAVKAALWARGQQAGPLLDARRARPEQMTKPCDPFRPP